VEVIASRTTLLARLGPMDVNLLGFIVTVAELTLDVDGASADIAGGLLIVDALRGTDQLPASVSEQRKIANAWTAPDPDATAASADAGIPRDGQRHGSTTEG
ncbi:MAG: hypothetical protein M3P18_23210, partial [Actinomycetota bacterium]|nr:hypothetical protein [Actinomycetota bacterium]